MTIQNELEFDGMNESITDVFNLSLTIKAIEVTMSDIHKCHESGCKGPKYAGLSVKCCICMNVYFFECIADRAEVSHLLSQLNVNACNEDDDQQMINEEHTKIRNIFCMGSVFEFVCPSCKNETSIYEMMQKLQKGNEEMKNKNDDLTAKNTELRRKNTKANNELKTLKDQNAQTQSKQQANPNAKVFESDVAILKLQIQQKRAYIEALSSDLKMALVKQQSLIDQFKSDSDNIYKESIELLNKVASCVSDQEETDDETDDNLSETPTHLDHENRDRGFQNENKGRKISKDTHPFSRPSTSMQQKQPNTNFANQTELHEIHISPFETSVECADIVRFILRKTKVKDAKLFSVQRLGGYNRMRSFVSFKVSTLQNDVYKEILANDIWQPFQTVRPFNNTPPRGSRFNDRGNDKPYFGNPFASRSGGSNWGQKQMGSNYRYNSFRNFKDDGDKTYIPRFERTQHEQQQQRYDGDEKIYARDRQPYNNQQRHSQTNQQPQNKQHQQRNDGYFFGRDHPYDKQRLNPFSQYGLNKSGPRYRSQESIRSRH